MPNSEEFRKIFSLEPFVTLKAQSSRVGWRRLGDAVNTSL